MELTAAQRIAHSAALDADPEGHPTTCPICAQIAKETSVPVEDPTAAAELAAAKTRNTELEAELQRLRESQASASTEAAVAAAVAEKETEIDQLSAKLLAETGRADAAEQALADKETEIAEAEAKREADAQLEQVKAERVAALAGLLSEERIQARADFYAGLDPEAWAGVLEDLKANAKEEVKEPAGGIAGASAAETGSQAGAGAAQAAAAGKPLTGADATRALLKQRHELAKMP